MPVRKAERLVNLIVYLLESSKPRDIDEIQRTIPGYPQSSREAFKRMFERDKDELREMGIPIERQPTNELEKDFGYKIPKDRYYLPEVEFEADELAALWMAAGLLRLADPATARTALLKLTSDLVIEDEGSSLSWLAADVSISAAGLPRAFEAVAERRSIHFGYRTAGAQESPRTIDPYGLVHRRGVWYVVGEDHADHETKSFRFDRMTQEVRLTSPGAVGPQFDIPDDFRLGTHLVAPPFVLGDDAVRAIVHLDAATSWRVERECPWVELLWNDDGSAETHLEVTEGRGFISWLLSFGEGAEVLEPQSLRDLVREHLEALCA